MRKLLLILMVSLLVVALAAPAVSQVDRGFMLAGSNGYLAILEEGTCELEVGFVWAQLLRLFATDTDPGETWRPHSDLYVRTASGCGDYSNLEGTVPTVDDARAEFETLEWANVDGIPVPLYDGETLTAYVATVDLTWTATGEVERFNRSEPGKRQVGKDRAATVAGTVTVDSDEFDTVVVGNIAFYNEIQRNNLP